MQDKEDFTITALCESKPSMVAAHAFEVMLDRELDLNEGKYLMSLTELYLTGFKSLFDDANDVFFDIFEIHHRNPYHKSGEEKKAKPAAQNNNYGYPSIPVKLQGKKGRTPALSKLRYSVGVPDNYIPKALLDKSLNDLKISDATDAVWTRTEIGLEFTRCHDVASFIDEMNKRLELNDVTEVYSVSVDQNRVLFSSEDVQGNSIILRFSPDMTKYLGLISPYIHAPYLKSVTDLTGMDNESVKNTLLDINCDLAKFSLGNVSNNQALKTVKREAILPNGRIIFSADNSTPIYIDTVSKTISSVKFWLSKTLDDSDFAFSPNTPAFFRAKLRFRRK